MERDTKNHIMLRSSKEAKEAIEAELMNNEEEQFVEKKFTPNPDNYIGSYIDN